MGRAGSRRAFVAGVEQIEQREEVALVGAAAVEEDEQPFCSPAAGRVRWLRESAGTCRGSYLRARLLSATRRSSSTWSQPFMKSACAPKRPDATCEPSGTGG